MEITRITLVVMSVLLTFSCSSTVDMEKERDMLLALNERQREAHFEGNPALMAQGMADTVYTVQRGNISVGTKPDMVKRWEAYFKTVKYSKWDDLQEPLIEISADGTLASMSVKKITVSTLVGDDSGAVDTTYFAWTSEYKKINGDWKIFKVTSTRVAK